MILESRIQATADESVVVNSAPESWHLSWVLKRRAIPEMQNLLGTSITSIFFTVPFA